MIGTTERGSSSRLSPVVNLADFAELRDPRAAPARGKTQTGPVLKREASVSLPNIDEPTMDDK